MGDEAEGKALDPFLPSMEDAGHYSCSRRKARLMVWIEMRTDACEGLQAEI